MTDKDKNQFSHKRNYNSRIVYENRWISVREDRFTTEDGLDMLFGITKVVDGIAVLAVDHDNVYLVDEFKYAVQRRSIEVVCGAIDKEDLLPVEAAKRELKEELGFKADRIISMGVIDPFTSVIDSKVHLFIAIGLEAGTPCFDAGEDIVPVCYSMKKAFDMVDNGTITHAPTILLLQKYERLKKELNCL
ncbi:NUDIX hydrolase [Halosquirtibacter laminarini]|uniref:NUDIX hydrolase n=1 Tax=Halosquirtibacter laminarini TaxID=3374600 RepID=A0AC61NG99_9BACT|nr:NUDIX hydrolase [Prolixibacteraceae bacterium]